jgi:hypothetical protein
MPPEWRGVLGKLRSGAKAGGLRSFHLLRIRNFKHGFVYHGVIVDAAACTEAVIFEVCDRNNGTPAADGNRKSQKTDQCFARGERLIEDAEKAATEMAIEYCDRSGIRSTFWQRLRRENASAGGIPVAPQVLATTNS